MSVVLMYHAIFADGDTQSVDAEDLPYAVSVSDFTRQLDVLVDKPVSLYDAGVVGSTASECDESRCLPAEHVVITFDDGHLSNLTLAAPLLAERNLPAYFFITSDFINNRDGFMSADELSELAHMPNVCIGSHGITHRFFDDLSDADSAKELLGSRQQLAQWTGADISSLSFPGGRFNQSTLAQMESCGYTQWFGSEIGLVHDQHFQPSMVDGLIDKTVLPLQRDRRPLCRVAIRRNTQMTEFRRIISQDSGYFQQKRRQSQVKHLARRVLGNRLYHGLYKSISAR